MTIAFGAFERALVLRAIIMWLVVRVVIAAPAARLGNSPVFIMSGAALVVVISAVSLCWIVTRSWSEDFILANLGTPPWMVALLAAAPPVVLELVVAQLG